MRGKYACACLAVLLAFFAFPATIVASDRTAAFSSWSDVHVPQLLARYRVPGAAVATVAGGRVTWAKGYGLADIAGGRAVTNGTVFQVASISKSLTAWGVMKLVEQGRVDLDAPVDRYLKRWHLPPSAYNAGVTVRRVLSHTAGLSLHGYPGNDPDRPLPTLVESLEGHNSSGVAVRVVEKPGKRWSYSGGGYAVLQLLIEDVTGMPFAQYMRNAVLGPLGMNHSSYTWERALRPATARAYSETPRTLPNYLYPEQAAAGLYTTGPDLARFVAAVVSRDAGGVLKPQSLQEALAPAPATSGAFGAYGFGVSTERLSGGDRIVEHTGGNRGWSAIWIALPAKRSGLVVLTNSNTGSLLFIDASCSWSRQIAGAVPQTCTALGGVRFSVFGGTIAIAALVGAYIAFFASSVMRRRRRFAIPHGRRWLRLPALLIAMAVWVAFWHTTLATSGVGVGLAPSLALPAGFVWASAVVVLWLVMLAGTAFFPANEPRVLVSPRARAAIALAASGLWTAILYTDAASRLILRTPGPRAATLLSTVSAVVATVVGVTAILAVSMMYRRRRAQPTLTD